VADYIDAMAGPGIPQVSRWDRGDGAAAIRALDGALVKAGLPGRLVPALRLLDRAEALASSARVAKEQAAARMEQATKALLADGPVDAPAYTRVILEAGPWLDDQAAGMVGVMQASQRVQANATQTAFALVPAVYRELQGVCAEVVAEVAAVPTLPAGVWSAATSGLASTAAIRAGREEAWAQLVRLGIRWDDIHAAAELLRESGMLAGELLFPAGCPERLGTLFLNWQPALEGGLEQVRRLPAPLRVRAAVDRSWKPGLWLKADHDRERAAAAPRPGLLARLVGSSPKPDERVEVG
jgi:hypothetical protein